MGNDRTDHRAGATSMHRGLAGHKKERNPVTSASGDGMPSSGLPDAHMEALVWLVRGGTWCKGR
jgi:hypothetical protein